MRTFTYDGRDRIDLDTTTRFGVTIARLDHVYGPDSQLQSIKYGFADDHLAGPVTLPVVLKALSGGTVNADAGEGTHTFGHDESGRLTRWQAPATLALPGLPTINLTTTYGWDAAGNRTSVATDATALIAPSTTYYRYDNRNRLVGSGPTAVPPVTRTWEERGHLDADADVDYTFDALGRQTARGASTTTYDGLDRIAVTATSGGLATDTLAYVGAELDPTTSTRQLVAGGTSAGGETYRRGPSGSLLAITATDTSGVATTTWTGRNSHGDLTWLYNPSSDQLDARRVYDPFGQPSSTAGAWPDVGFQSDWTHPDTGEVWQGARWYQPTNGTFTARDTIIGELGRPVTLNRYTYAFANPMRYWDPNGRYGFDGQPHATRADKYENASSERQAREGASNRSSRFRELRRRSELAHEFDSGPTLRPHTAAARKTESVLISEARRDPAFVGGQTAPVLGLGVFTFEVRIVGEAPNIIPDGENPERFRYKLIYDTGAGSVEILAHESCRELLATRCQGPLSVHDGGARFSNRTSTVLVRASMGDVPALASLHVNFRADGFGPVPGSFPGGITADFALVDDAECDCVVLLLEHDRYPTTIVEHNGTPIYRFDEVPFDPLRSIDVGPVSFTAMGPIFKPIADLVDLPWYLAPWAPNQRNRVPIS